MYVGLRVCVYCVHAGTCRYQKTSNPLELKLELALGLLHVGAGN